MKHKPTTFVPETFIIETNNSTHEKFLEKFERTKQFLTKKFGKPYYSDLGFIIYNNSCLDFLNTIKKNEPIIDLTITSPPYNIGKEYETLMDIDQYTKWCSEWMNLIYDNTVQNSSFWLNLGHFEVPEKGLCVPIPYLIWDKSNYYFLQELVWQYGAGVQTKKRLSPRNEKWLFYVKNYKNYIFNLDQIRDKNVKYPNQKKNGKLRCHPLGKNPSDVWEIPKVTTGNNRSSKERVQHPAQFPLAIIERLVKVSSNELDIVYDPFSGSGTTGIASNAFNRIYIGTEIDSDYCKTSVERFERFKDYRKEMKKQIKLI